jgi:hypothetical protein
MRVWEKQAGLKVSSGWILVFSESPQFLFSPTKKVTPNPNPYQH